MSKNIGTREMVAINVLYFLSLRGRDNFFELDLYKGSFSEEEIRRIQDNIFLDAQETEYLEFNKVHDYIPFMKPWSENM